MQAIHYHISNSERVKNKRKKDECKMDSFKHKQFIITLLFLKHIYRCVAKREENIKECEIYLPDINEQGLVLN